MNGGRHGAELVATAHDGEEALRLCEEYHPHIVITDIRMPVKDGLYLMKHLHSDYPEIQIIAISAHGIFEYAKQAMQAGCLNYILKPISSEELNESIQTAISIIQNKVLFSDREFWHFFEQLSNNYPADSKKADICILAGKGIIALDLMSKELTFLDKNQMFCANTYNLEFIVFILDKKISESVQKQITEILENKSSYFFAWEILDSAADAFTVSQAYQRLQRNISLKAFWLDKPFYTEYTVKPTCLVEELNLFWSMADEKGMIGVLLKRLKAGSREEYSAMEQNEEHIICYLKQLVRLSGEHFDDACSLLFDIRDQEKKFYYTDIKPMLLDIRRLIGMMCGNAIKNGGGRKKLVWQIRRIINTNYSMDIDLGLLASLLSYSEGYISRTFKKETGNSINQYLIDVRMRAAASLLEGTNRKIGKIAEETGYRDYFHFEKQFRKYFGMTPGKYREQNGKKTT